MSPLVRILPGLAGLLLLAALPACDDDPLARQVLIEFDQSEHPFVAVRQYTSYYGDQPTRYLERIRCAGDGRHYEVTLLALDGLTRDEITDPAELRRFDSMTAMLGAGTLHRVVFQRDFRVDDADRLFRNYRVIPVVVQRDAFTTEPSAVFHVRPFVPDRPFYEVTVSTSQEYPGFLLGYREYFYDEYTGSMVLMSELKVLELDYGTSGGPFDSPDTFTRSRTSLTILQAQDRAAQCGLPLVLPDPKALPNGFELESIEEIEQQADIGPGGSDRVVSILRFVYSDGVDRLEILEHEPAWRGVLVPPEVSTGGVSTQPAGMVVPSYEIGSIKGSVVVTDELQMVIETRITRSRFARILRNLRRL